MYTCESYSLKEGFLIHLHRLCWLTWVEIFLANTSLKHKQGFMIQYDLVVSGRL